MVMSNVLTLKKVFNKAFYSLWSDVKSGRYLRYTEKGGRGSAKSTHIAMTIILLMKKLPVSALVVRKVGNTLSESVVEQLKEAVDMLGMESEWYFKKSPMMATYLPRGNSIYFRGADDPGKIKSFKVAKYPLTILWVEELAEFKIEDEIGVIEKSVLRAELPADLSYYFFYSYNPPKRKQSWVNKKFETKVNLSPNTRVHHTTYKDNPHIATVFVEEAEHLLKVNKFKYDWEYGGEPIGNGVVPFNNLVFRKIPDEEFNSFDNIRQGLDFGYATDPVAGVQWHYDKTRRRIYAMREVYGVKMSNRELAAYAERALFFQHETIADSEDPRTISELKNEHGWSANYLRGAKKGPDSVIHGENWLDDLESIIIDPDRTPNLAREFENIDYETDKDGNPKPRLEDKDNHCITGDTLIDTVKGQVPIKELVGTTGLVKCFNEDKQIATESTYFDVRLTRENAKVFEIETESGRKIKATSDHLILTINGWKMVKELNADDEIRTL